MDIEDELLNNEQSVRLLKIMIDIINSRTLEIIDDADNAGYKPNLEEARKQALTMVRAMSESELKHFKEYRKAYLNRVMDSTFDYHFSG